ncbi:MAG: hypothetical protein JNM17_23795 [Archangium sp.]|nr:hypothetical protein [Archangium sp.]
MSNIGDFDAITLDGATDEVVGEKLLTLEKDEFEKFRSAVVVMLGGRSQCADRAGSFSVELFRPAFAGLRVSGARTV